MIYLVEQEYTGGKLFLAGKPFTNKAKAQKYASARGGKTNILTINGEFVA